MTKATLPHCCIWTLIVFDVFSPMRSFTLKRPKLLVRTEVFQNYFKRGAFWKGIVLENASFLAWIGEKETLENGDEKKRNKLSIRGGAEDSWNFRICSIWAKTDQKVCVYSGGSRGGAWGTRALPLVLSKKRWNGRRGKRQQGKLVNENQPRPPYLKVCIRHWFTDRNELITY